MEYICKPKKISIYINTRKLTAAQVKAETGADAVINGGLFNMSTFSPIAQLRVDRKTIVNENWGINYGFAWDTNVLTMTADVDAYRNFIGCVCLVRDGEPVTKLAYPADMGGSRQRTAIGVMNDGSVWLMAETAKSRTPEQLRDYAASVGCVSAVMLDGGASTQCAFPGYSLTGGRKVHNMICIWEDGADADDTVDMAVEWALGVAADSSHGYDQTNRWGPDYDCSSLVISAFEQAGIKVKTAGATYTGNMRSAFLACGFRDITTSVNRTTGSGLKRGDVLLNQAKHTALYLGDGMIVHAASNESGKATGGMTGDQTGGEICTRAYYNSPWDVIMRYGTTTETAPTQEPARPTLRKGSTGQSVRALQALLKGIGYTVGTVDGCFGDKTYTSLARYQSDFGLTVDGVCGAKTWVSLLGF